MLIHKPETQTLYAQLFEATAAYELELIGGFSTGVAIEREVRGSTYLYWQIRDLAGVQKQIYLGPRDDERAGALRDALVGYKTRRRPILDDLKRLTAAYVASGGARHFGAHFKVLDALARAGLFRSGVVLVGSHAFVSIGAMLGVSFSADAIATTDIDFCRDDTVSIACDTVTELNVPGVLKELDPSFFLVPELDLKAPSTSVKSRKAAVTVDFLTVAKTSSDTKPRMIGPFGLAAQPLRYMDYLVRHDVQRGLFLGPFSVLVHVPHAGRFALHKLAVASCRVGGETAIKADKDRRQAAALVQVLLEQQPGALNHAVREARKYPSKQFAKHVQRSLARIPAELAREIRL